MADQLFFNRDTKVFVGRGTVFFEIPILADYSFSQGTNTSEITLNEAENAGVSRRARQMFNDSFAPSEWSFTTYMRPFKTAGDVAVGDQRAITLVNGEYITDDTPNNHHAVEEVLWDAFVNNGAEGLGTTSDITNMDVNFSLSNSSTIGTFDLYFVLNADQVGSELVYKIANAVVDTASIDFDIDGIAQIAWNGFGSLLTDEAAVIPYIAGTNLINEGIVSTSNYIRNRLSTLALVATAPGTDIYSVVLTGGNITFANNIQYLTPETLGSVNQPLGHVTGTRSVSGNFTAYLDNDTLSTAELFEDLVEATTTITTNFAMTFSIGGASAPKVEIAVPTAHLEIPSHSIDDVIGVDVNFHGLPSTIDGTNEATVIYFGA